MLLNNPIQNQLILSGQVVSQCKMHLTPAGVPIYRFWLEHRSSVKEAGFTRQAWCRMQVILTGKTFSLASQQITVGGKMRITGFIHSHLNQAGTSQLVLHAEHIEFID